MGYLLIALPLVGAGALGYTTTGPRGAIVFVVAMALCGATIGTGLHLIGWL
jgi:hypothetical protein